jgi:hypothetical protein
MLSGVWGSCLLSRSTMSTFERGFHSEADRAGFSEQEDLLSPTPSERFPVSHWVTFGQLQKISQVGWVE